MLHTLLYLVVLIIIVLSVLTVLTQQSADQKSFLAGKIPAVLPDGLYKGSTSHPGSWLGKKFDAKNASGINLFGKSVAEAKEEYPFKTSVGKGIRDTNLDVIKIDYNIPTNPFWLRPVLDEIVEIAPNTYLGKLHLRVGGFVSFSLTYFRLIKQ